MMEKLFAGLALFSATVVATPIFENETEAPQLFLLDARRGFEVGNGQEGLPDTSRSKGQSFIGAQNVGSRRHRLPDFVLPKLPPDTH